MLTQEVEFFVATINRLPEAQWGVCRVILYSTSVRCYACFRTFLLDGYHSKETNCVFSSINFLYKASVVRRRKDVVFFHSMRMEPSKWVYLRWFLEKVALTEPNKLCDTRCDYRFLSSWSFFLISKHGRPMEWIESLVHSFFGGLWGWNRFPQIAAQRKLSVLWHTVFIGQWTKTDRSDKPKEPLGEHQKTRMSFNDYQGSKTDCGKISRSRVHQPR